MTWLAGAVIVLVIALLVMAFLNVFVFARRRNATFDYWRAEALRFKADHLSACGTIADMHAAATGRFGDGPTRGVVEDVADLRADRDRLRAELDR